MKKILLILTIFVSIFLFITNVQASSFEVDIVGDNTFEKEITLYVEVNNFQDFKGACDGLCGLVGDLIYDTSKIELVSIDALENFDLIQGKTLVLYKSTGVATGTKVLSMKFKNKSLKKDESTNITFSNIIASDGDKDINAKEVSKTIKFVVKEDEKDNITNNGDNNNTINKPSTNITTKNEEIKKSNNNYLSSISLSDGNINFDKNILNYNIIVDYEITKIEIKAIQEDSKAIITGNGNYNLKVGNNIIKIKIEAEDESQRIYTLNVNRKEKNIVVEDENEPNQNEKKQNNYIMPIIIIIFLVILGGIGIVTYKKNNKSI